MVDYQTKAPGVYIQEIIPPGPIAGASTSVAAFIGMVTTMPTGVAAGQPVAVTNWTEYTTQFGDYQAGDTPHYLPFAVRGFFDNGGTFAYVVPIADTTGLDAALTALTRFPDVSIVCAPDIVDGKVQPSLITHCETMGDRIAVLDGIQDGAPPQAKGPLMTQLGQLSSDKGLAALYWPWITIVDPRKAGVSLNVPPSGHVAGMMARCDDTVGVHKAPANEVLRGAIGVATTLNDTEQGVLNQAGVNVIRNFDAVRVWGARTLAPAASTQWRYVNVRRLVCFIEDSLVAGLRWAVFEPNNTTLWKGLERTITEFLTRVWEAGALFGATAKNAFYVQITEELNPPAVRDLGEVVVQIGIAPTRPAEFVVLQIGLWDGGTTVTEA
jgi:phage tail sheath protein FI